MSLILLALPFVFLSSSPAASQSVTGTSSGTLPVPPVSTSYEPSNAPLVRRCFYNGRWYLSGSVINTWRNGPSCYKTHCGVDGQVKYLPDNSCTPQAQSGESTGLFGGLFDSLFGGQSSGGGLFDGLFGGQSSGGSTGSSGGRFGCWVGIKWYAPGNDISNRRSGNRCFGSYCDWNSNVQRWNDACTATVPPPRGSRGRRTGFNLNPFEGLF